MNVLITGTNGYISNALAAYIKKTRAGCGVDMLAVRTNEWRKADFSRYDAILHLAGVVHSGDVQTKEYYRVNRDLTEQIAKKAKCENVAHFVFMSTMSVYGKLSGHIDAHTVARPKTHYAKSKLAGEIAVVNLETDMKVSVLRPPMVYGKNCPGNYRKLVGFAKRASMFPDIKNKRSAIYIDNLCEFVCLIIENASAGIFMPQNDEYMCTSSTVKLIADHHGNAVKLTKLFNPVVKVCALFLPKFKKVFSDLTYARSLSEYTQNYNVVGFVESVKRTEGKL